MASIMTSGFFSSINLLGTSAYPSSQAMTGGIWYRNRRPHDGSSSGNGGDCIVIQVLTAFGIPIANASFLPASSICSLPGYDINNMDALGALKLGLAVFLKDGKIFDIFINKDGMAEFVEVYPHPKTITLESRMCIPTSSFEEKANVVIVSGYDPPPVREIRAGQAVIPVSPSSKVADQDLDPLAVSKTECCILSRSSVFGSSGESCQNKIYESTAIVSYRDPVLDSVYKGQGNQLYDPKAFESLVCYIIDFDTGHNDMNVSYQTSPTTQVTYSVPFGQMSSFQSGICAVMDMGSTYAKFGYIKYVIDPVIIKDRYGTDWPIMLGIQGVEVMGHTVQSISDGRYSAGTFGSGGAVTFFVDDRIVNFNVPAGKHWHWTYEGNQIVVYLYSPVYDDALSDYIWSLFYAVPQVVKANRAASLWAADVSKFPMTGGSGKNWADASWPNLGAGLGTLVYKVAFTAVIERPSIVITDPHGNALDYARKLHVTYYPVVMVDNPAPVAYNIGGITKGVVDHSLDIFDNDPSTVQADPASILGSNAWLQTQKTGHTLEISLPFLETKSECEAVADILYDMYNNFGNVETTYSIVCGPDDEPELGAAVDGFPSHLRINEISYNYQDGSSYNINVTLGPVFVGTGGWNTSIWQRRTETVSREGIITWSAGDGCTYRVRVRGLGEYYGLNASDTGNYVPGERVNVRIFNNPMEK